MVEMNRVSQSTRIRYQDNNAGGLRCRSKYPHTNHGHTRLIGSSTHASTANQKYQRWDVYSGPSVSCLQGFLAVTRIH